MEFLAKSKPKETIREHTDQVLEKLEDIFRLYGHCFTELEKQLLRLACQYHDYGKIEQIFQEIVHGSHRQIEMPHGFLSGLFLFEDAKEKKLLDGFSEKAIKALYTAIHYHHNRTDDKKDAEYCDYACANLKNNYLLFTGHDYSPRSFRYLKNRLFVNVSSNSLQPVDDETYRIYLLIKGILNKADYAASGKMEIEIVPQSDLVAEIHNRFGNHFRPAQTFMKNHTNENVILLAPTGSGKTEAAILWLNGQKGFYTLPMKVSANAIFDRIHGDESNQYHFKESGILHSDSLFYYLLEQEDTDDQRLPLMYSLTRQLAMPLTVTTVDQLFRFVFKALGTELYAATLKYSKLIIDEMQMYSPRILAMLLFGLQTISRMGGHFAIVTATLPKFIIRYLTEEMKIPCQVNEFVEGLHRHWVHIQPQDTYNRDNKAFDLDTIIKSGNNKKVLVLCNTVKQAQELYTQIPEAHLLHSRFIKEDRLRLENDIQEFANDSDACGIWISTMLVEASLDIDFDELHTEMCSADSLLQRLGRCFRKRTWSNKEPNAFVYDHGPCGIYDQIIYDRSLQILFKYTDRIFTEAEKLEYIDAVFDEKAIGESDYLKIFQKTLSDMNKIPPIQYTKQKAEELFRDIKSETVMPDSIYQGHSDEINDVIDRLEHGTPKERYEASSRLDKLTITIKQYGGDWPYKDSSPIPNTTVYRTVAQYDFDPETGTGQGLMRTESKDSNFI